MLEDDGFSDYRRIRPARNAFAAGMEDQAVGVVDGFPDQLREGCPVRIIHLHRIHVNCDVDIQILLKPVLDVVDQIMADHDILGSIHLDVQRSENFPGPIVMYHYR